MRLCNRFLLFAAVSLPLVSFAQSEQFNADSALAYTRHLSVEIGPRPMGSPGEQEALHWATAKFADFSADTAYILALTEASVNQKLVNTRSGTAVGIFKGQTDSTIVVGGHIDSSGPEIPGANDDGSGTACVIELARIWGERARHFTLVFTAFGGEESGLVGSKHFAANYEHIDSVILMLQIDMSASRGPLIAFIETTKKQTPRWLVEDAFNTDKELGYNSLSYPVNFFSLNNALGGAGSDHEPFIERGIPAIDFTAGINTSPIHTPGDKFEFVNKDMLARSGRIVDAMLEKYQAEGVPAHRVDDYMLLPLLGRRFYLPSWLVTSVVIFMLAFGILAFIQSRRMRLQIEKSERIRFSGSKLLLVMLVIAVFAQLGEAGMQLVKGLRYPWFIPLSQYLLFAAIWAFAGVWVGLQATRFWRFSADPYVFAKRSLSLLIIFTVLLSLVTFRLALYPGLTLLIVSLAVLIPNPIIKIAGALLAPIPMFKLMFSEVFPFIAQNSALAGFGINSFARSILYNGALTLILVLWYLPSLYFIAGVLAEVAPLRSLAGRLRSPVFGAVLALIIVGYGGYIYGFPAYDETWRAEIRATASYDIGTGENEIKLTGNEYFRDVTITADTLTEHLDERIHEKSLPLPFAADWLEISGSEMLGSDPENDTLALNWQISSSQPWRRLEVKITADTLVIQDVVSDLAYTLDGKEVTFVWLGAFRDTVALNTHLALPPTANLIRSVKATYDQLPVEMEVNAALADVIYRTEVSRQDTLAFRLAKSTQK